MDSGSNHNPGCSANCAEHHPCNPSADFQAGLDYERERAETAKLYGTEQAKSRVEITDEMAQRALDSFVIETWERGDEHDILLDHDRMRAALEAAING